MRRGLQALGLSVGLGVSSACIIDSSADTDTDALGTATDLGTSSSSSTTAPVGETTDDGTTDAASSSSGSSTAGTAGSSSSSDGGEDDGPSGPPPLGPACSVQEVTDGAEYNTLSRGSAGQFPFAIADDLEDYCGCHTLSDNRQNTGWEFLRPPAGTLFLSLDDLSRGYDGTTLGASMLTALDNGMPPGSCPHPTDPLASIRAWLEMGMPDAPNYPG